MTGILKAALKFGQPEFKTLKSFILITIFFHTGIVLSSDINQQFIIGASPVIAFTGATIIDGTGAEPKQNYTVVVENGRITKIYPDETKLLPENAKLVSLQGKSLLPGWILMHEHLFFQAPDRPTLTFVNQPISFSKLYLASGVTSARTAGSMEPYYELRVKEAIDQGRLAGPDYDLTAPYLEGGKGAVLQLNVLKSDQEAIDMVYFWAKKGFTSFKAYTHISKSQLAESIKAAHRHGLKITAHLGAGVTYREAADLGLDQIEHGFMGAGRDVDSDSEHGEFSAKFINNFDPLSQPVQSLIKYLIDNNVILTSTLEVLVRTRTSTQKLPDEILGLLKTQTRKSYEYQYGQLLEHQHNTQSDVVNMLAAMEVAFWKAGGTLTVGSDAAVVGTVPGYSGLSSIELLAKAGIPPLEVIKIATKNGAVAMGVADDRGTIEVGKRADIIIVDGDPYKNISDIYKINMVMKKGVIYDPIALKNSAAKSIGG